MSAAPDELDPPDTFDLSHVDRRLEARFCPPLHPRDVRRCTADAVASLQSARIRTFVLLLVERAAADRLRSLAAEASAAAAGGSGPSSAPPPGAADDRSAPRGRVDKQWWSTRQGRRTIGNRHAPVPAK